MSFFRPWLLALVYITLTIFTSAPGQGDNNGEPYFDTQIVSTFQEADGQPVARVIMRIVNDHLTFIKSDSGYHAGFFVDIFFQPRDTEPVYSRSFQRDVSAGEFSETNSGIIANMLSFEIPVEPGAYDAVITVKDQHSSEQYKVKREFEISELADSTSRFMMSDIVYFSKYDTSGSGRIISFEPELTNRFDSNTGYIFAYFTTYVSNPDEAIEVVYKIRDAGGKTSQENQYSTTPTLFKEHYIRLNRKHLPKSRYTLQVVARQGDWEIVKEAEFGFFWKFVPGSENDLREAIRQLKFIADEDSIKYYLKRGSAEQQGYFKRFWDRMDPDPTTRINELKAEYYRRVNYSNANFGYHSHDGWISDRGRIYIKFGEPDDIERHPFEAGSYPYVIWRYYSLRKSFLFIDRTGFGDYVLHPRYQFVEYE